MLSQNAGSHVDMRGHNTVSHNHAGSHNGAWSHNERSHNRHGF